MMGSKFLRVALFSISNLDPAGFIGGVGVLLGVAILSSTVPARRAMHLNVARHSTMNRSVGSSAWAQVRFLKSSD